MRTINIEFITPERTFLSTQAQFVVLPGISGELGILPGHVRLTSLLKPGIVKVDMEEIVRKLVISNGVARVEPDYIKVFSPTIRWA
ncbi:MAG: ATP synthase F1 subunit epsilon [Fibrobacter sp.]|jgi:F-type H+-transporting ATPase subunit epsilon|nr:ATP synthase F1 subunit epsilon [Fibrobacter sp.]HON12029.1 ATP synthase F1 subunit epsilon [Chitinispirillaceae bacterium]